MHSSRLITSQFSIQLSIFSQKLSIVQQVRGLEWGQIGFAFGYLGVEGFFGLQELMIHN